MIRRGLAVIVLVSAGIWACDRDAAPVSGSAGEADADIERELRATRAGGGSFELADLRGSPVVLVFFRGAFCGICVRRLRALDDHLETYRSLGADVVAVAPEGRGSADDLDVEFPVVETSRSILEAWGVWKAGEEEPRPAAVVLDAEGTVRFEYVGAFAADRPSDVELLSELRSVVRSAAGTRTGRASR